MQSKKHRKPGWGSLIARRGRWALRWRVDGRVVQEQTDFRVGPKSERLKAEKLLEERTEIFRLKREQDQLAVLIRRRESIEARIKELSDAAMPAGRPLLLRDLEREWRASPRRRDTSERQLESYSGQLAMFVSFAGAEMDFRSVGDELAERYAKHLSERVSPNTYNKHLNTLSAIWKAVGHARGVANPWQDLPRRRLDTHVRRALSPEEVAAVIAAAEGEWRALVVVGARTGLRLGDACRIRWADFGEDGVLRVTTSKTGAAVAIPASKLLGELKGIAELGEPGGLVMPGVAAFYAKDPSIVSKHIRKIFEAAGLTVSKREDGWAKARPDATYHSLRHTFVTRAIEAGVAAPVVRALVGHSTAAMTDRYTHIGEAAILREFGKIEGRQG